MVAEEASPRGLKCLVCGQNASQRNTLAMLTLSSQVVAAAAAARNESAAEGPPLQQAVDYRERICTAVEKQLQQWEQQHLSSLLQQAPHQRQQEAQELPLEEIRVLWDLLQTAAAAGCSGTLHLQLQTVRVICQRVPPACHGLRPLFVEAVSRPLQKTEAAAAALWAAAAATAAAVTAGESANATLVAAAQVQFGVNGWELLLLGASTVHVFECVGAAARRAASVSPVTLSSAGAENALLAAGVGVLAAELNSFSAFSGPLPSGVHAHLEAVLAAAEAGAFAAEITSGEKATPSAAPPPLFAPPQAD
ncbi:uncharacterized protein LOC113147463 [Cyclospora cayetanensis]|uniref:Uncharacterized protein LOC113147463 n=1 Tax=Cyclospora cayetanensis TaxID=88456 RepID=A0A6P6S3Q3_9EIME|nr:uncharacterized protein LOC113147463 [Cyclospora cayetanensis]